MTAEERADRLEQERPVATRRYDAARWVMVSLAVMFAFAGPAHAQTRTRNVNYNANIRTDNTYDITIRNLSTTEQQLLDERRTAVGMRVGEIERELKTVREQIVKEQERLHEYKMEELRLQTETAKPLAESRKGGRSAFSPTYNPPSPPATDWKAIEKANVVVKSTFKQGDRYGAMVSGGQIVFSNDVFATTYQGKQQFWRVTYVDRDGARFEPVRDNSEPLPPGTPPARP